MSEFIQDSSLVSGRDAPIYPPDKIVTLRTRREIPGIPIGKPLWIRKSYNPSPKNPVSRESPERSNLYLVKDGPGEKAKDLGWVSEERLMNWSPPESLIDLEPENEEAKKGQEKNKIEL